MNRPFYPISTFPVTLDIGLILELFRLAIV